MTAVADCIWMLSSQPTHTVVLEVKHKKSADPRSGTLDSGSDLEFSEGQPVNLIFGIGG